MPYKNWRTFTINANCHQQDMSSKTLTNFISEKGVTFSKRQNCSCSHKRLDFQVPFKKERTHFLFSNFTLQNSIGKD
jgi:hypothetical protein